MPRQQFLKPAAGAARARVVSAKFFDEFLIAVYDPEAALDVGIGRESFAALANALERRIGWFCFGIAWEAFPTKGTTTGTRCGRLLDARASSGDELRHFEPPSDNAGSTKCDVGAMPSQPLTGARLIFL